MVCKIKKKLIQTVHLSRLLQGDIEQSIVLLERALERSNTSAFIYHQLGLCYKRKKIDEQKLKHFDKQSIHEFKVKICVSVFFKFMAYY